MDKEIVFELDGDQDILNLEVKETTKIAYVREKLKEKCAPKLDQFATVELKLSLTTDGNVVELNPTALHSVIPDGSTVVIHHPPYKKEGSNKRQRAKCYRQLDFEPNFSYDIPFEAHVRTVTRDNIVSYIQGGDQKTEPRVVTLFAPPGFGKTDAGMDAAREAGCMYARVVFSRTGICRSLRRNYRQVLDALPEKMSVDSLLAELQPLSVSFVAHALNLAYENAKLDDAHVELTKNGYSVFSQPETALGVACKQIQASMGQKKLLLHFDEVSEFMVSSSFIRKPPAAALSKDEYSSYLLISLSAAIYEALSQCHHNLRVMFTGTTNSEAHLIRFTTALKEATVKPPGTSTPTFVAEVVNFFLDLTHLNTKFVDLVYAELAGCKRSIQWFLHYIDSHFRIIRGDELTEAHITSALEHAREQFLRQASENLLGAQDIANDALLAFAFHEQFGGSITSSGISFPRSNVPADWYLWNSSGAVYLEFSPDSATVTLQRPYPFMVSFLQANAKIVTSSQKELLQSFLLCCMAQPDTMPGLAFQFAVARELTNQLSPLLPKIFAKFSMPLQAITILPTVHLFTVPSDLPPAEKLANVFMVVDQHHTQARYVDVAAPVNQLEGSKLVRKRMLFEVKRKVGPEALRKDCRDFFEKCQLSGYDDLFVFLSYFPVMEFEKSGKNIQAIQEFLKKPNFLIIEGAEVFEGCSFPFDLLKNSAPASDVLTFRKNLLSSLPMKQFFTEEKTSP